MIIKKVHTSKKAAPKSKGANVRALVDYVAGIGTGEKVEHRGSANLLAEDHDAQVQEMVDLAEVAKRAPQPVQHWIFSWKEGEQPTAAQADQAVSLFLKEMGLSEHQAVYGLHSDTDNWHLHLAVNRVHPESEKVVTVNGGFDIEVAHRALARIELAQGWQREANALFREKEGQLERARPRAEAERQPSNGARDFEERIGARSAERVTIEDGAGIIRKAGTWKELHQSLAVKGLRFEKKGSGALLWVGDQAVKASTAGRDCSMAALEKRLGAFEPALPRLAPDKAAPGLLDPVSPAAPGWHDYAKARREHGTRRAEIRRAVEQEQRAERKRLADRHRGERSDIFRGSWKGKGALLNATRSVLASRQAQEKAALRDRLTRERQHHRREVGCFPNYDEWLRDLSPELAEHWRHRERRQAGIMGPAWVDPKPQDIRAFSAQVDAGVVHYRRTGQRQAPAFTDRGNKIDIYDSGNRDSVLAALQLSAQKWGGRIALTGGERFKRLAVQVAVEHGITVVNPELQQDIEAEKSRQQLARTPHNQRPPDREPAQDLPDVYRRHLEFAVGQPVAGRGPGGPDPSRIDAQVAVQMRMTGHPQSAVEKAIRTAAEARRPGEQRDWAEYARRAAGHAWSVPGDRASQQLASTRPQLLAIEGRQRELDALRGLGGPLGRG